MTFNVFIGPKFFIHIYLELKNFIHTFIASKLNFNIANVYFHEITFLFQNILISSFIKRTNFSKTVTI